MKTLLALVMALSLTNCTYKRTALKRPFVIIYKGSDLWNTIYTIQDSSGQQTTFTENDVKYQIGDTIK